MLVRDPGQLYERHGRQLLVTGVQFDGQQSLFALGAALAADSSPLCQAAAEACARYLVGAGLGRILAATATAQRLAAIDPELQVVGSAGELAAPCVHIALQARPGGAEAELAWIEPGSVRDCLVLWRSSAGVVDAVALGAAVAQLAIDDALGLQPLPAVVSFDLSDAEQPLRQQELAAAPPFAVPAACAASLAAACAAAYPLEAAGALLRDATGGLHVAVADPSASDAFTLSPQWLAEVSGSGATLLALWHSHPDGATDLSTADAAWAATVLNTPPDQLILATVGRGVVAQQLYGWSALAGRYRPIAS